MSATDHTSNGTHRVVIVGAGFSGLFAGRFLKRSPVEVTLVDRTNHRLFQPLLHQVATRILSAADIATPTRDVLRKQANAHFEFGEVADIDLAEGTVIVERPGGQRVLVSNDSLVVGAGVGQSYSATTSPRS